MAYEYTRQLLTKALYTIGGELFADEATSFIERLKADEGDEEAIENLTTADFVKKIFSSLDSSKDREGNFWELVQALKLLAHNEPPNARKSYRPGKQG